MNYVACQLPVVGGMRSWWVVCVCVLRGERVEAGDYIQVPTVPFICV